MIKKVGQALLINFFCICILLSTVGTIAGAEPIVEDITLIPEHPAPQSAFTFSVDISGDTISSVCILINECNKQTKVCHAPPQNISLRKIDDNTYEGDVTLEWDDVNSITYKVVIESDGEWITYDEHSTALSMNSETNGDGSNGLPGFEIVFFLIAIICCVLLFKRVKSK